MNLNKKNSSKKKIAHQALKEAEERKSNYKISKKIDLCELLTIHGFFVLWNSTI